MNYMYLVSTLILLVIWLVLYLHRKDLRKEILIMSFLVAVPGLFLEAFVWTVDWWQPETITNTVVGIEDFILGFALGGIIASFYEEVFKKRLVDLRGNKKTRSQQQFWIIVGASLGIGFVLFFILNIHSFIATLFALILPTLLMYVFRKDLISISLYTGVLAVVVGFPVYWALFYIYPQAYTWWFFENLTSVFVFAVPLEDILWLFATGIFVAPLYEMMMGKRLVSQK